MNLHLISKYRPQLMGLAILFVVMFHVSIPQSNPFFGLQRMGNVGVDMFLLLSGIGLWFSFTSKKNDNEAWWTYYRRRLKRVYPTWFVVATAFYVWHFTYKRPFSYVDLAGDILLNWDFWLHCELKFWYVPATMMLYIFAHPYMRLIRRHPVARWMVVLMVAWCFAVEYVEPIKQSVGHIEIFWSRVPIFFIGINLGAWVKESKALDVWMLRCIPVVFAVTLCACMYLEQYHHGDFPIFYERLLYIPLCLSLTLCLCRLLEKSPQKVLIATAFLGGISLEIYLIHCQFVLFPFVKPYFTSYWLKVLLTLTITIPIAKTLQKVVK